MRDFLTAICCFMIGDDMKKIWMISANSKYYRHADSFASRGYIDWRKNAKYSVGDIVYIYCTKPFMKIMFMTRVLKVDLEFNDITDDKEFWNDINEYLKSQTGKYVRLELIQQLDTEMLSLQQLKKHGLKAAPQGPMYVSECLNNYITGIFNDYSCEDFFGELSNNKALVEGAQKTILVNKYERSIIARNECIKHKGCYCHVCNMNFMEVYGDIGKDFIHVHHIKALSEIKDTYKINYKNDLIPLCPNCHAMLHRKLNGKNISLEQLKRIYEYYNKIKNEIEPK